MSGITFIDATDETAEFFLFQAASPIARLRVADGDPASIPTMTEYTAQAFTSMGEFKLASNPVNFTATSIVLLAQVVVENGFYDFQLLEKPGIAPEAITLENTWSAPVEFKLTRPNTPFQIVAVVGEHNYTNISTVRQWTTYAVVDGITTAAVAFSDPNTTVTLTPNSNGGFTLSVS